MDSILIRQVEDARRALIAMIDDLDDQQLAVPYLPTINPPLWEACHATYFQEYWVLRHGAGQKSSLANADELFDSAHVGHEARWRLPMPSRAKAMDYLRSVSQRTLELLESGVGEREVEVPGQGGEGSYRLTINYLARYSVMHEDMHTEALTYLRQSLGYPAPRLPDGNEPADPPLPRDAADCRGDVEIAGGEHWLGAPADGRFAFDNERPIHRVTIAPFRMSRTAVSEGEFAAFVDDGGYEREELWHPDGWAWRLSANANGPLYWRHAGEHHEVRYFDTWRPVDPPRAMLHVNWYEADAFCRWAGRRLPTEAEWEFAATGACSDGEKRKPAYPWGDEWPTARHLNTDWRAMGPVDVRAHAAGDSPFGLRQMLGNVWEWTATTFAPFEGFHPDMYRDYSQTSFHTRKVLRGGCCYSRTRMLWTSWRNYYQPYRRDVFGGFRTCAPRDGA